MKTADAERLREAMRRAADAVIAAEPLLTRADSLIGDGDHGLGMKRGFTALKEEIGARHFETPYELFHACGVTLVQSMGGASGVLFGTLFIGGLPEIAGLQTLDGNALRAFLAGGTRAVMKRGKAAPGDKTMADALLAALEEISGLPAEAGVSEVMRAAAEGARRGAEQTREMLPRLGRARGFRERAVGVPDPGALSVSVLLGGLAAGLKD